MVILYIFIISLFIFCIYFTIYKKYDKYSSSNSYKYINKLKNKHKVKYLLKLEKIQNKNIPWYMKSFSTIGVLAFFSMIFATLLQTININTKTTNLEKMKIKYEQFSKKENLLNKYLDIIVDNLIYQLDKGLKLTKDIKEIISLKIQKLKQEKDPDYAKIYNLSMIIRDYDNALEAITSINNNSKKPYDIISLSEYLYKNGQYGKSRKLLIDNRIYEKSIHFSKPWRLKVLVLMSLIKPNNKYINQIRDILNISNNQAIQWLNRKQLNLKKITTPWKMNNIP